MENKLQQLTEKLYNDGLNKGKAQADALIEQAKVDADAIIAQAKKTAETIINEAKKTADNLQHSCNAEIKLASEQTMVRVRQTIEKSILTKVLEPAISKTFGEIDFIKNLIQTVINQHTEKISIILPANQEKDFETLFRKGLENLADKEISFDKNIKSGFQIKINNGGYLISFTDKDFAELFKAHIHDKLSQILFGVPSNEQSK